MGIRMRFTCVLLLAALAACAREPVSATAEPNDQAAARSAEEIRAVLAAVESAFNAGDLDAAMSHFTPDAIISGQGDPDVAGAQAIREMYAAALGQITMKVAFHTEEIEAVGDLAVERGTYTVDLADKATGTALGRMDNRHVHIMRKGEDGQWRTWRMMVNAARGGPPAPLPPSEAGNPVQ